MNFSVIWMPDAEEALAEIWLQADDRAAIVAAGDRLDRSLTRDPFGVSESRTGATRIVFVPPLVALFDADLKARTVRVTSVWTIR